MRIRALGVVFSAVLLLGLCVPEVAAQALIHSHPGWLDSATQEGFDVAEEWPADYECCWPRDHPTAGSCTFGVNNPVSNPYDMSDFWNPSLLYEPSSLWIFNEGAYLQSTCAEDVTAARPWLFVQFHSSDMNDGVAEIAVQEVGGSDWLTVGSYDTFGRGNNWVSIEGLPLGPYYVRITSRWNGRMTVPPNGGCTNRANSLQPARIGHTAAVPPENIHVTGGGLLTVVGGKASISMDIAFTGGNDRPTGTLTYTDHVHKASIQSTAILGIEVLGDEAWIRLAGLSNSGTNHTVYAHVRQGGAGVGKFDINVSHDWTECKSGWFYQQHLTLGRGQIKVH